ncbi:MAG: nucleotidyltransferase family protein [Thermodesulfobacteriota bacterium]|nr:nucleotidyltransferase family protein [Thermodesulfobacteriota bacterium]
METEKAIELLSAHMTEIRQRFGVESLALFGSVARGEARPESDLDVLVVFRESPGMFDFLELKQYIEQITASQVDLVTEKALKKQLKSQILEESIRVH